MKQQIFCLLLLLSSSFSFESNIALNTHHKRVTVDHFINITLRFLSIFGWLYFIQLVLLLLLLLLFLLLFVVDLIFFSLLFFILTFFISLSSGYSTTVRLHVLTLCFGMVCPLTWSVSRDIVTFISQFWAFDHLRCPQRVYLYSQWKTVLSEKFKRSTRLTIQQFINKIRRERKTKIPKLY